MSQRRILGIGVLIAVMVAVLVATVVVWKSVELGEDLDRYFTESTPRIGTSSRRDIPTFPLDRPMSFVCPHERTGTWSSGGQRRHTCSGRMSSWS
jgi:hypothetical protein